MLNTHSDLITDSLKVGIALHEKGIYNWVLTKDQALVAIENFKKNNIALLGGETYLERFPKSVKRFSDKKRCVNNGLERRSDSIRSKCALNGLINPNGDSWSVEKHQNESDEDYINRSLKQGLEFIGNPIYEKYCFILVLWQ